MFQVFVVLFLIHFQSSLCSDLNSKWYYQCTEGYCQKTLITANTSSPLSFAECSILCLDSAGVWPKPTGLIKIDNLAEVDVGKFSFSSVKNTKVSDSLTKAFNIFTAQIKKFASCKSLLKKKSGNLISVNVDFNISDQGTVNPTLTTDESYSIKTLNLTDPYLNVGITAQTYFGARNALETLGQLIVHDDLRARTLFPMNISIEDKPVYLWRGLTLDTSRNFVSVEAIKRTLRAMAASKLNTFHWHLTDTASFPYFSKSHPELSENGAYSPAKVYTDENVRDVVEYARVRGIKVIPELDAPAHVGEGWVESGVITCFNWKPWQTYCAEPPCGQFDPSKPELYDILEGIYGDMLDQFGTEVFHMGGDEVNVACWNDTKSLTTWMVEEKGWGLENVDFLGKLWPYFQTEAAKRLYKQAGKELPIILWNSELTTLDNVTEVLPPSKYIIQVWPNANDEGIQTLLEKNYTLIISNSDALYLDCGFAGWVTGENNWCSPYKGWQLIYDNKPTSIAGSRSKQVLGGETALWTEQSGTGSLDSLLWPRAAAFAETLWTEPATDWTVAEERMLLHRDRLVKLGIQALEMQPEWCLKHQQHCPIGGKFNK